MSSAASPELHPRPDLHPSALTPPEFYQTRAFLNLLRLFVFITPLCLFPLRSFSSSPLCLSANAYGADFLSSINLLDRRRRVNLLIFGKLFSQASSRFVVIF
uniref:Uncharacterized protein n=1 Tax=Ananas comosus var. bracteatus TaxID=296719 RepID=A0A6V7PLZ9_ANACO|nr:unnamed protein product [Ananas comosus var. bracteatus]